MFWPSVVKGSVGRRNRIGIRWENDDHAPGDEPKTSLLGCMSCTSLYTYVVSSLDHLFTVTLFSKAIAS